MATKTISTNYLVAQAASLVLNPATAEEANVRGLTGLTLPLGFEMSTVVVSEMGRRIDLVVPSGGQYSPIDITANFVPGDATQAALQAAALNSTKLTAMRFYLKAGCDFAALDLINDSGGGYLIGTYSPPTVAGKNELFQSQLQILPAGSSILFVAHSTPGSGDDITFAAESGGGATATLSTGSWVDMGFEEGDTVIIDWNDATTDPLYVQIESMTATVLTFAEGVGDGASVVSGTGLTKTQVHGATPIEVEGLAATCD